jgi:ATP-binding cassette subfamily B protein
MELLDAEPKINSGEAKLPRGALGLKLVQATVRAPHGQSAILDDCSLSVAPSEIVALVGPTGSGKSTLAALMPRLVDADEGEVLIGSNQLGWQNVNALSLHELRKRVHVVPQEAFLFSDTIAANLRLGNPEATKEDLLRAIHLAAADDVLASLPEGLETRVGDRGLTLSGGQRQRLALARAFVAQPSLLVLDDATSALDALTERTILNNVRNLSQDLGFAVTTFVVASKLSTVMLADRVAVLVGGSVVDEGTHERLSQTSVSYRELLGLDDASRT